MMLRFGVSSAVLIASATAFLGTTAKTAPSLTATDAWLTANLPNVVSGDDGFSSITHTVNYAANGCTVTVTHKQRAVASSGSAEPTLFYSIEFRPAPGKALTHKVSFQDQGSDPNSGVSFDDTNTLDLSSIDLDSLRLRTVHLGGEQATNAADLLFWFAPKEVHIATTDQTAAQRSLRALRHAAVLCGAHGGGFE